MGHKVNSKALLQEPQWPLLPLLLHHCDGLIDTGRALCSVVKDLCKELCSH